MTAVHPGELREALHGLTHPAIDDATADVLGRALLPDLKTAERMGRVFHIREYAAALRAHQAGQANTDTITLRRIGESELDHYLRAGEVASERLAMAVDAAVGRQMDEAEARDRQHRYAAGSVPLQRAGGAS